MSFPSDPNRDDVPSYPQRDQGGYDQGYQQPGYEQPGYGQQGQQSFGPRSGGRLFPFPSWTTRTRGGSTVTVGGCCLPLPIGCLATTLAVGAVATSRAVRHLRG